MTEKGRRDFCIECRKETEYLLQKKDIVKNIRDKDYTFAITVAVCAECGEEMARKWWAENDYGDYSREMKKRFKWEYISLSDLEDPDGDGTREMSISDEYYDMEEDVFTRMECEQLYRALAKLTRDEILLINELFYSDQNISDLEAGRILGVSRQTIRTQKRAVLNKLRDYLEKGFHV